MFTNENHEDDSKFSVNLTNDNQMYDTSMANMSHQLHDYGSFVSIEVHDKDEVGSQWDLQLGTSDKKRFPFRMLSNNEYQYSIVLDDPISMHYHYHEAYTIELENLMKQQLEETKLLINLQMSTQWLFSITYHESLFISDYGNPCVYLSLPINCIFPRNLPIVYSSKNFYRFDDLVDRYHNNIHFMNQEAQLIRDLILFHLTTSPLSLSTMLRTITDRFSQADHRTRKKIEDFCLNYQSSSALDYYTQDTFFYRVLNHILRQQRDDIIYQYRHAIVDVIECLRQALPSGDDSVSSVLYRGQQMTIFEVEKMMKNIGELLSVSSFFSTTKNRHVAQIFAGNASNNNPYLVSVIFKIYLDTGQPKRPYAPIDNSGEEEEVLFSPGTRFVLISCRKLHDDGRLWLFELKAISKKQQEQLELNHGETFLLLSSASGWPDRSWLFIL